MANFEDSDDSGIFSGDEARSAQDSDKLISLIRAIESRIDSIDQRLSALDPGPSGAHFHSSRSGKLRLSKSGGYTVEFNRQFNKGIEEVFKALSDPSRMVDWFADAHIDAREGGKVELRFANSGTIVHGILLEHQSPTIFSFMWVTATNATVAQPMPDSFARSGGQCGDTTLAASVTRYVLTSSGASSTSLNLRHYVPLNSNLIAPSVVRAARASQGRVSEQPAPNLVLASWDIHLNLLDEALNSPGNRAMSLNTSERRGSWPWSKFSEVVDQYGQAFA